MESTVKGGLEEWIAAAARQEHARPYLRVAELLRQRGVISLSNEAWPTFEASPDRPPCHPSRFIEKLLRTVPAIVAFSSSRKDGWLLAARAGGGMYDALAAAYRLARGLEERELQAEALTEEELTALEAVLEPSEKVFVRYVLCQVFGVEGTAERFGFGTNSLRRIVDKVSAVLEQHGGQIEASSPQKKRKEARTPLKNQQRGGRKRWEAADPQAARVLVDLVKQAGAKIHPSLNDSTLHLAGTGTKIRDLKAKLDELVADGVISLSPSPSAMSRAMTRPGGRGTIPVRAQATKKVLGEKHPDLEMLNKLHQNMRSYYLQRVGDVALMAYDDLEKMPLDELAFNGRTVQAIDDRGALAPSYNFGSRRKLIFTSWLVLSLDTVANQERLRGRRPALRRHDTAADSLPLAVQQELASQGIGDDQLIEEVGIKITDRSGPAFTVIRAYGKDGDEHQQWSQPSTSLQHADDLLLVYDRLAKAPDLAPKLRRHLFSQNEPGKAVPWLIQTTDGPSEQTVRYLQNVLPLWELLVLLDLDGIEKVHYCPNHSKTDPAERVNATTKRQFRGRYIESGEGSAADMARAKERAKEHLANATHAGEPLHAFVQPRIAPPDQPQIGINSYEELLAFSRERAKRSGDHWYSVDPTEDDIAAWDNDDDKIGYRELERKVQLLKQHIRYYALYAIVIAKCEGDDLESCNFCSQHPPRGATNWYSERTKAENAICPAACPASPCDHSLNADYAQLLLEMRSRTPDNFRRPIRCGICRQEGHDRRKCAQKK